MNLSEHLRQSTKEILDSLEKLDNEVLRNLQREKDAREKDKKELAEKEKRASAAISRCQDELDKLGKRLTQLRKRRDQLIRRLSVLKGGQESYLDEAKEPEASIERLNRKIQQAVEDKEKLEEKLKAKRLEAFTRYLAETRERLDTQAADSKELESKRASRKALEKARHSDPEVMELWERRVELKNLTKTAKVYSNKVMLQQLLQDVERSIDQLFPGALTVERYDVAAVSEEILYSSISGEKTCIFLPFDKNNLRFISENPTDRRTRVALRLAYALGKMMSASPGECKIKVGKHGWAMLISPRKPELVNRRFSVTLSEDISCSISIHPLPIELEELVL